MARKYASLALLTSGFLTVISGISCIPSIGAGFQGILDNLGLGNLGNIFN